MRILYCPHAKGVSRFAPEPDRELEEEYKKDVCPFYIPQSSGTDIQICPRKIEEKNRN
jgi:hypothetical protein